MNLKSNFCCFKLLEREREKDARRERREVCWGGGGREKFAERARFAENSGVQIVSRKVPYESLKRNLFSTFKKWPNFPLS